MKNDPFGHPAAKWLLDLFKDTTDFSLIHKCPYQGQINVTGLYLDLKTTPIRLPDGVYKTVSTFYNHRDDKIFQMETVGETSKSNQKDF